jgi:hypothetical protein
MKTEIWPLSSNSPNNGTQTKSITVYNKNELMIRKQHSTCLNSWAPGQWPSSKWACLYPRSTAALLSCDFDQFYWLDSNVPNCLIKEHMYMTLSVTVKESNQVRRQPKVIFYINHIAWLYTYYHILVVLYSEHQ